MFGTAWTAAVRIAGPAPPVLGLTGIAMLLRRRARRGALHTPWPCQACFRPAMTSVKQTQSVGGPA